MSENANEMHNRYTLIADGKEVARSNSTASHNKSIIMSLSYLNIPFAHGHMPIEMIVVSELSSTVCIVDAIFIVMSTHEEIGKVRFLYL